jgi:hypothetical protein
MGGSLKGSSWTFLGHNGRRKNNPMRIVNARLRFQADRSEAAPGDAG